MTTMTTKKKQTPILSERLPVIKLVKTTEETLVRMELEMDDETHDMLVNWGKQEATDEDYVGIAIRCGLKEYLDKQ